MDDIFAFGIVLSALVAQLPIDQPQIDLTGDQQAIEAELEAARGELVAGGAQIASEPEAPAQQIAAGDRSEGGER